MLILSRRNRESAVVGRANGVERPLKITVLQIRNGTVRLGFEAGDDFHVRRWVVWEWTCAGGRPDAG
jgi:sRNA-binding carbon storage regulator CsrA